MKKEYSKPTLEVEVYQLNAALAAGCENLVSFGPGADGKRVCDEYKDAFEVQSIGGMGGLGIMSTTGNTPFYGDGAADCDCYYTSGGVVYVTS